MQFILEWEDSISWNCWQRRERHQVLRLVGSDRTCGSPWWPSVPEPSSLLCSCLTVYRGMGSGCLIIWNSIREICLFSIYLNIQSFIYTVWTHGHLFYALGYRPILPYQLCVSDSWASGSCWLWGDCPSLGMQFLDIVKGSALSGPFRCQATNPGPASLPPSLSGSHTQDY